MKRALVCAGALALAGCDAAPPTGEPGGPIRTDNEAAEPQAEEINVAEAGDLPEAGPGPRFVGMWAADEQKCETTAWQFTETMLNTPAGSSCSFNRVTEVPGGYDIQATCSAEGPPTSDTLKLRFAESADAMMFESETIADAGLVFCGRTT